MKRVIIESPYAGNREVNQRYLLECLKDSLRRGEAPFASHVIYTLVLDDDVPEQRRQGIEAGFAWGEVADLTAVYTDLGVSAGMQAGIDRAKAAGRPVEERHGTVHIDQVPMGEADDDIVRLRQERDHYREKYLEGNLVLEALNLISQYGGIDGAHHKTWVIDQVVRLLAGPEYEAWVTAQKAGEDGPDTYEWNEGTPP